MYTANTSGAGADVVVLSGGTLAVVGATGSNATITRFNGTGTTDRYSLMVQSGGTIQAQFCSFEYMDTNGIQLADGAILHPSIISVMSISITVPRAEDI